MWGLTHTDFGENPRTQTCHSGARRALLHPPIRQMLLPLAKHLKEEAAFHEYLDLDPSVATLSDQPQCKIHVLI